MTTALLTHEAFGRHRTPAGHPERTQRFAAICEALAAEEFVSLRREPAPAATDEQLLRVHPASYLDTLRRSEPDSGIAHLDADTAMSAGSWEAAVRAAGSVCRGIDLVTAGSCRNAFCVSRPPGHHAERARAMGFCLLSNAAVGARHAQAVHGLERVAILDFDVHHGNGTQHVVERDASVFFASSHQMPLFPGTGAASETGVGNVVNVPLAPFEGSEAFRAAWRDRILPRAEAFRPELVIVSAGFDAHEDDPLGQIRLGDADFEWITQEILGLADRVADGRVVSTLEGGYDLGALARSAVLHVRALTEAAGMRGGE